ncbi:hypothetical protein GCM10007205_01310 [Oxalicibacterium flavum]|uniref:Low affinity iron permease family protein n=1 Tax=Oxalicibacterium flavum TaxID=179467 RepID=A0A8J2UJS2_9BURK|nr:low affinity iron permease family protein [Oxalicibacterium flavum]GGB95793.1 hypothetical protein GCM10007205_01310 [Oxalicibacterium flavum]
MQDLFRRISTAAADMVGSSWTFIVAVVIVLAWAVSGPLFHFSDTWQLLINTGTTIITFLMVFLIQHAQNRDAECTQLKLDELIRAVKGARTMMIRLEDLSDEDLKRLRQEFSELHKGNDLIEKS